MRKYISVVLCVLLVIFVSVFALADDEELYYSQEAVDELQSRINDLVDENETLHIENDKLQENNESLALTNEQLRDQVDGLQSDQESLQSVNDNLSTQLSMLQSESDSSQESSEIVTNLDSSTERTGGLVMVVEDILGKYTPRTETITTSDSEGNQTESTAIVSGVAGMDWNWIASAVLFVVMLYGIIRIIGGVLSWN